MAVQSDNSSLKVRCPFCHTKLDLSELPAFSEIACPKCRAAMAVPRWFQNILLEEVLSSRPGLQVFRALDPTLDREACVKLMLTSSAAGSPLPCFDSPVPEEQLPLFLEVFRKMSLLVHPNIVPVCSCGALPGAVYGVTGFISGQALNRAMENGEKPGWPEVLASTRAAAEALNFASRKQLHHGHLTPENLLLDQDGVLHITDFMTALTAGKDLSREPWTAPEFSSGSFPDCRSDIFSLGVCLYEYVTGNLPYPGTRELWRDILPRPVAPHLQNSALPEKYSELLLQMIALEPGRRPQDFQQILEVLNLLGKSPGRGWQRKKAHSRRLHLSKSSCTPPLRLLTSRKTESGWLNKVLLLLLLAAIALGGVLLLRQAPVQEKLKKLGLIRDGRLTLRQMPSPSPAGNTVAETATEPGLPPPEEQSPADSDPGPAAALAGFRLAPELLALRPRPEDYDFKAVREQISTYLAAVPPEAQETEKERIRYLGSYKTYLLSKISKMAYSPTNPSGIRLKNGEKVTGSVTMFSNEKALKVRPGSSASSSLREIPWQELPCREVLNMAYSYVQRNAEEIRGRNSVPRKKLEEVYDEYFYLILLADWYQETGSLQQFCREAEQLPIAKVKEKLSQYIDWPL